MMKPSRNPIIDDRRVKVSARVRRMDTATARVEADKAQPVSAALDVSVENSPFTNTPSIVVTVWGHNEGHGAFIHPAALRGFLEALISAYNEITGKPEGPVQ